jgi:chromosomal replication initiation ATPase DnaA
VLLRHNAQKDIIEKIAESEVMIDRLELYTGMSKEEIEFDLQQKRQILKWMAKKKVVTVDEIGLTVAKYYTGHLSLD